MALPLPFRRLPPDEASQKRLTIENEKGTRVDSRPFLMLFGVVIANLRYDNRCMWYFTYIRPDGREDAKVDAKIRVQHAVEPVKGSYSRKTDYNSSFGPSSISSSWKTEYNSSFGLDGQTCRLVEISPP